MNPRLQPVDRVVAVYNLFLAAAWMRAAGAAPLAWLPVLLHVALAGLPWLLAGRVSASRRLLRGLREGYPLLVLAAAWAELGWLQEVRRLPFQDDIVRGLDQALFGGHPHLLWSAAQPQAWLSELMHGAYLSYYLFVFLPPLVLAVLGRRAAYRDWVLRLLVTYLGCYVFYTFFPVYGPRLGLPETAAAGSGWLDQLTAALRSAGDSLGTAFPSSHVAGVVTSAWLASRWLPRPLGYGFAAGAFAVCLSTVYTQNHYAVDVVAGLAAALVLQTAYNALVACNRRREAREAPCRESGPRIVRVHSKEEST